MNIKIFIPIEPPTLTGNRKTAAAEQKVVREKFLVHLYNKAPEFPLTGPIRLVTKWNYPSNGKHKNGEWKTTPKDVEKTMKIFKDAMTKLEFWKNEFQVASEITESFWSSEPGIYIIVEELETHV